MKSFFILILSYFKIFIFSHPHIFVSSYFLSSYFHILVLSYPHIFIFFNIYIQKFIFFFIFPNSQVTTYSYADFFHLLTSSFPSTDPHILVSLCLHSNNCLSLYHSSCLLSKYALIYSPPPIPSYPDIFSYPQSDFAPTRGCRGRAGEILCGDFMLEFPLHQSNDPPLSFPEQYMVV